MVKWLLNIKPQVNVHEGHKNTMTGGTGGRTSAGKKCAISRNFLSKIKLFISICSYFSVITKISSNWSKCTQFFSYYKKFREMKYKITNGICRSEDMASLCFGLLVCFWSSCGNYQLDNSLGRGGKWKNPTSSKN